MATTSVDTPASVRTEDTEPCPLTPTPAPVRTQDTDPAPLTPAPAPEPGPTPNVPTTAHAAAPPPTTAPPLTVELKPHRIELNRHQTATERLRAPIVDT